MDLIKSYAHKVVSYLPAGSRDELFAEIYDNLSEEYRDLQEARPGLGQEEFLNSRNKHPMKLATELAADQSAYLVGPGFYFSFLATLKTAASVVAAIFLLIAVISAVASGDYLGSFIRALTGLPLTLLWVCAVVLGIFVALERSGEKASWLDDWEASDLQPEDSHREISRSEAFFDLGVSAFALLWIADIVSVPGAVLSDGQWIDDWRATLPDTFWAIAAAMFLFDIAFSVYRLTRSLWSRSLRLLTIASNLAWLLLIAWAVSQPVLLATQSGQITELLPLLNTVLKGFLVFICAFIAWDTLVHAWRLWREHS